MPHLVFSVVNRQLTDFLKTGYKTCSTTLLYQTGCHKNGGKCEMSTKHKKLSTYGPRRHNQIHYTIINEYLMIRMVVVGLCSEGVKTTATSLDSQGCSSRRKTPSPVFSSIFLPTCTDAHRREETERISQRKEHETVAQVYFEEFFQGLPWRKKPTERTLLC